MSNCLLNVSNAHSKILEQAFHFMVLYVIKVSLLRSVHGKLHKYASAVFLVQALTLASFVRMHVRFNVFYLLFHIKKFCLQWVMMSLTLHKDSLRVACYYALVNAMHTPRTGVCEVKFKIWVTGILKWVFYLFIFLHLIRGLCSD